MKSKKSCDGVCSLIFVLFIIVVILGCIRYYEFKREKFNSHYNSKAANNNPDLKHNFNNNKTNPCSKDNFHNSLQDFYQDIQNYRSSENDLKQKLIDYEESYKKYDADKSKLEISRKTMNNCINVL